MISPPKTSQRLRVKNQSFQGLEVFFIEDGVTRSRWMAPHQIIYVQDFQLTEQAKNLNDRKLIQINKV